MQVKKLSDFVFSSVTICLVTGILIYHLYFKNNEEQGSEAGISGEEVLRAQIIKISLDQLAHAEVKIVASRYAEAIQILEQVIKRIDSSALMNSDFSLIKANALEMLAECYARTGNQQMAEECMSTSLEIYDELGVN